MWKRCRALSFSASRNLMSERCLPRAVEGGLHNGVKEFAFIPDGGLFAVLSAGNIVLWDVQTRDLTGEVPIGVLPATGVRSTSDDRHLVYTDAEGLATFESPGRWRERERSLLGEMKPW